MDILREKVTGTSELTNVLSANGFEVIDFDQSSNTYTVTYSKCDTDLSFTLVNAPSPNYPGYISFVSLYGDGICINYGVNRLDNNLSYAFLAPEADEDRWVLLRLVYDIDGRVQIKIDEDEGWRYIFNHESFPTLNGIQLVNYYDFPTQAIFGNLYICKKLPAYRLLKRYYWDELGAETDPRFPNIDKKTISNCQHIGGLVSGERNKRLFGERIRIDDKIFIVVDAFNWNYGTNRTDPEDIRSACPAPVAFRVT